MSPSSVFYTLQVTLCSSLNLVFKNITSEANDLLIGSNSQMKNFNT